MFYKISTSHPLFVIRNLVCSKLNNLGCDLPAEHIFSTLVFCFPLHLHLKLRKMKNLPQLLTTMNHMWSAVKFPIKLLFKILLLAASHHRKKKQERKYWWGKHQTLTQNLHIFSSNVHLNFTNLSQFTLVKSPHFYSEGKNC